MVLRVEYFVPIAIKSLVEERIESITRYLPAWVNVLTIRWQVNDEDIATAQPQYEYRSMTITLHPAFLHDTEWSVSLMHEVAHAIWRPYVATVDKIVEKFAPDVAREYLLDVLASKEEEISEDLSIFIKKVMDDADV